MTSATFRVVARGLQPGQAADIATHKVAALFSCSKEQAAPLLSGKPVTVKKALAHDAAAKYARALERCGCLCVIEPEGATPLNLQQMLVLVPVLRRVATASPDADPIVVQPFAGDLEVVFRAGPDNQFVRTSTLLASMMTLEKLYALAIWNLYKRLQPRLVFKQMATGEGADDLRFFSYIEAGDSFEAACLLLWPIWQGVAEQVKGPLRIALPNAQTCWFCSADDPLALAMMADIAAETLEESGDDALSGCIWSVDANGLAATVPDMGAPAQLVMPVLHAQAERAALMPLSEERLRRLQPLLFDRTQWRSEEDRTGWIKAVAHTLARGDSRAAVVIDAANGIVAAYTDELDCVMLLRFDPAVSLVHGWQEGTRLLSANSYAGRDDGVAADLLPGAGDKGRWGDFWPLIADLLTDDHARLAARKREIDPAEWERAAFMGRRALAAGTTPRDGRPLASRQPAPVVAAPARAERRSTVRRRAAEERITFWECLQSFGYFVLCAWAVWGAGTHVTEMPRDGLFYLACFGILAFTAFGLLCLSNVVLYLRD